jgi:predicted dehydrogenase/threonine dehydrogenase-like Zn-dependent dehydrogenase
MKQVVFKGGHAACVEVPAPQLTQGQLRVDVRASSISPGTEMAGLSASGMSLWQKALANPEKLMRALDRMKTEGIASVLNRAQDAQESEGLCGYSAAGVVAAVGAGVSGFAEGMGVAVAGAGYANHASCVSVPVNLAMRIPEGVSFEDASTCALGGIAMQGIRRAEPTLGEYIAVVGCGVLGLLTVQMLRAAGCRVLAVDLNPARLELAGTMGAELLLNSAEDNAVSKVMHFCNGHGADRVILTVATNSNEPLSQAFRMCRRKGRVVLVGTVGSEFKREDMYAKELDFVISTSYGPGRYDEQYERLGRDYPYGYVRWTEKRNMEAYLELIARGSVKLDGILAGSFPVTEAARAYEALASPDRPLLVTLTYPKEEPAPPVAAAGSAPGHKKWSAPASGVLRVGLIGAGSFVRGMHVPNLLVLNERYRVAAVCDQSGTAARQVAGKLPGCLAMTDYDALLAAGIDMVLIGTRHDSHADLSLRALQAGKAVFVEKPMCITAGEFARLSDVIHATNAPYMVGYNRRFAPPIQKIRPFLERRVNPLMIRYLVNGGHIPYDSWVHTEEGGGRIVGEACHILDLFRSLTGAAVESIDVEGIRPRTASVRSSDNAVITVKYADGSVCTLLYTALGNSKARKERMEVFVDEQVFVVEDYARLEAFGAPCAWASRQPDKGHRAELEFFSGQVLAGIRFPIPMVELEETWRVTRQAADYLTA